MKTYLVDDLLEKRVGVFEQISNKSFNAFIWKITPKGSSCGSPVSEIAVCIAESTFNDRTVY